LMGSMPVLPSAERILSQAPRQRAARPDSTVRAIGLPAAAMPAGRPSPYTPDLARIAERLCRNGATDIEVADILGISVRTFYRWCLLHDEFTVAVRTGKDAADDRVERALYQRAVGYDYVAEKIVTPKGGGPVA